jgi:ectoine hydroxylase-related dioxygenase (phytanoyl-CoA dioxygenase family)
VTKFAPSGKDLAAFSEDGYLLVRQLFDADEMHLLLDIAKADRQLASESYARRDAGGGSSKLALRNDLDDETIYAAIVRARRVAGAMEQLLGDEVYHYHHKMMLKEPRAGGAWEWHQDYGYWYNNGCLYPDMASCLIAVDRANQANGCLQVLRGSHKMGRMNHDATGDQVGVDPERVAAACEQLELVYCEMEPGDALFFHGNTLHRSDRNTSEHARWSLICCYNTRHNDPYKEGRHPNYTPLEQWDDVHVAEVGRRQWDALQQAAP